ncbi:MAG: SCP2 sterol-binding domain-containing protein [Deltaproteobacteria bacterium]|jgi:hypothetical protein|nr:SCP2 sterol-binding domain-containing protein [Deltaproteobacteria bacterium]
MTIDELYVHIQTKSESVKFDDSLSASILLNIAGDESSLEKRWLVELAHGRAKVTDNPGANPGSNPGSNDPSAGPSPPDVSISLKEKTLLSLASGEMAPVKAFLLGRVKIKGDMALLGQLKYLWPES